MNKQQKMIKRNIRIIRAELMQFRRDNDNELHYTDAAEYANTYYGTVYRETTRFDNEWGDIE